jgi:predicted aconitase with swiveling domain
MQETYAHELERQTVIISAMPNGRGERMPVGTFLQVHLTNGMAIQNVTRIDFDPIIVCKSIYATLTLLHLVCGITEECIRVEVAHVDEVPAIVREERHAD